MSSAGQEYWIKTNFPPNYAGWAIDIGAANGVESSNTFALEADGWNVLCVEAMHANAKHLRHHRRRSMICAVDYRPQEWGEFFVNHGNPTSYSSLRPRDLIPAQNATKILVPVLTLNQILFISGFPQLDLLSIDIEGTELDAIRGMDIAKWRPKVIMAECWPHTDAAIRLAGYLEPFGYKDVITMQHDHGFVYGGDAWQSGGSVVHDGQQAVGGAGPALQAPADEPRGVRERSRLRGKASH